MSKEARLVKQLSKKGYQKQTPIATDMFLPNHSGNHGYTDLKNIQQYNTTDTDNNFYQRVRFHNTTEAICLGADGAASEIKIRWGAGTCSIETAVGKAFRVNEGNSRCEFEGVDTLYDGTNSVTIAQCKTAYDHSQTVTGNPHNISYSDIGTVDISANTNLVAGTNITLVDDTLNVDDSFLINDGDDTTTGTLTAVSFNVNNIVIKDDTAGHIRFTNNDDFDNDTSWFEIDLRKTWEYGCSFGIGGHGSNDSIRFVNTLQMSNSVPIIFDSSAEAYVKYDTHFLNTYDQLKFNIKTGGGSQASGYFDIAGDADDRKAIDYQDNPTLRLWSGDGTNADDWVYIQHNQTDAIIKVGSGDLVINDGQVILTGTAKVTKDLWLGTGGFKTPGTKPATQVDLGIADAWEFTDGTDDTLYARIKLPNDMDKSVAPTVSVGWSTPTADAGNCRWQVEYLYRQVDEDMTAAADATLVDNFAASSTANGLVVSEVGTLAVPHANDVCITMRIKRRADEAADTLGEDNHLLGLCVEYTSNKLGT